MNQLDHYFSSYNEYHRTPGNKITHYIGIPLIVLSTLGLLALVKIGSFFDLGFALWISASIFYCRLNLKIGLLFSVLSFLFYQISMMIPWATHIFLFVVGWIFQGIGHYHYEKKSPAFLTNLSHLLIGPFWIFNHLLKKFKISKI